MNSSRPFAQTLTLLAALAMPGLVLAQSVSLHGGLGYSEHSEDFGILVGASLPVGPVAAGADFTYLLTDEDGYNAFMIDVNGRYAVLSAPAGPTVSVMAGLNIFRWSYDFEGFNESTTDISPAAGARVDFDLGPVGVFGQGQYVLSGDSDGVTFGAGVTFTP